MKKRTSLCHLLSRAAKVLVVTAGLASPSPAEDLTTIIDAFRERQDRVKTVKMVWGERTAIAPASLAVPTTENGHDFIWLPDRETTLGAFCRLILDGPNWRYEADIPMVNVARDAIVMEKVVSVTRDGVARSYSTGLATSHPRGTISKLQPSDYPRINQARPPFFIFRSLSLGLFGSKYQVTSSDEMVDGRRHVVLEEQGTPWSVWLDAERHFATSRYVLSQNGLSLLEGNVRYALGNDQDWMPKGWSIVEKDRNGTVARSVTAIVKELAINAPVDPHEFELEFPDGTYVVDFTQKTDNDGTLSYEVLEGGRTRRLQPGEQ